MGCNGPNKTKSSSYAARERKKLAQSMNGTRPPGFWPLPHSSSRGSTKIKSVIGPVALVWALWGWKISDPKFNQYCTWAAQWRLFHKCNSRLKIGDETQLSTCEPSNINNTNAKKRITSCNTGSAWGSCDPEVGSKAVICAHVGPWPHAAPTRGCGSSLPSKEPTSWW